MEIAIWYWICMMNKKEKAYYNDDVKNIKIKLKII